MTSTVRRPTTGTLWVVVSRANAEPWLDLHYGQREGEGRHLGGLGAARLAVACAGAFGAGHEHAACPVDERARALAAGGEACAPRGMVVHVCVLVMVMHGSKTDVSSACPGVQMSLCSSAEASPGAALILVCCASL